MNPWNRLWLFQAWLIVGCGAGGYFLADTAEIGLAASVVVALMLTAVVLGSDRHDRVCRGEDLS